MATAQIRIDGDASGALRSIQQVQTALQGINSAARSAQAALSAMVGAVATGGLFNFVDELQNMQNKLRVATGSNQAFADSMEYVRAIADKTGQSLAATGNLYAQVAQNAGKLGYNQDQVVTVTNAMATALKVSGASAQGAASTLYQFGQILAKGKVNGDEFTTIMENLGGPVMDLVAKNMGLTTAELVKYKEKGLIGAKDFTDALIRSMSDLDSMGSGTAQTLGQSLQRIQNAFGTAVLAIDQATGFSSTFADVANKIASNGENLVPVLKAIGAALVVIGVVLAPIPTIFAAATAAAIYFADILGPILKPVITAAEAAISALIKTLIGLASAIKAVGSLENPFTAYKKAVEEFEASGKKSTDTVTAGNQKLTQATQAATAATSAQAGQLTGIGDKLKEILRDLDEQVKLSRVATDQYQIENQILGIRKQLEYSISQAQIQQIRIRLQQIDLNKQLANIDRDLVNNANERRALNVEDVYQSRIAVQLEQARRQYGQEAFNLKRSTIQASIEENLLSEAARSIRDESRRIENEIYTFTINGTKEREVEIAVLAKRRELGSAFTAELEKQYRIDLQRLTVARDIDAANQRGLSFIREMQGDPAGNLKKIIDDYNKSIQSGNEAAISGNRDRLTKEIRDFVDSLNERSRLFNDYQNKLSVLRDVESFILQLGYDKDSQLYKDYLGAKLAADQDYADKKQQMLQKAAESENLLRIQQQTGTQFGYATQKQMAAEAAAFEMKSTQEKTQFALEQGASIFSNLGKENKKAFEAAKAFNIANAVMNTYMGATKALATYPWPFGLIAAAAAVAAGMAQVSAIRSQQYSGRQLGGPVMGGKPYIVGENGPELFTPSTTGSITRNQDLMGKGDTNVNFYIQANDTTGFDELLTQRRGLITQIIRDAQLERGVRGAL